MQYPLACSRNRPNTLVDLEHTILFQIARQGHTHAQKVASPSSHIPLLPIASFTHNTCHFSQFQENNHTHTHTHTHTHMVASSSFTHNTFHLSKSQEYNHMQIVAYRSCKFHTFISTYISFLQVSHTTHFTFPNHKKTITHTCTPISSYLPLFQIPHKMHLCFPLVQITRQQLILHHTHTHTHIQLGGGF